MLHKFLSKLQIGLLVFSALGGIIIGGADAIGYPLQGLKDVPSYILVLLGVIALSIGLERWITVQATEQRLDDILKEMKQLQQHESVRMLDSYDEIYDVATKYLRDAKRQIRAVVANGTMTAPDKYRDALVEVLATSKKLNNPIRNDIVLAAPALPLTTEVRAKFNQRKDFYEKHGIADLIHLYFTATPASFDILVIDERHVFLSYAVVRGATMVQTGLAFVDQPRIASEMARWFDNALLPQSTPAEPNLAYNPRSETKNDQPATSMTPSPHKLTEVREGEPSVLRRQ